MQPPIILVIFQKAVVRVSEHFYDTFGLDFDYPNCVPHTQETRFRTKLRASLRNLNVLKPNLKCIVYLLYGLEKFICK